MSQNKVSLINKMYAYNLWANTLMINLCAGLDLAALRQANPAAVDRIQTLLRHTIAAEGNYVRRVTGSLPWDEAPDWDTLPLTELGRLARLSGQRLIDQAEQVDLTVEHVVDNEGQPYHFHNWVVLVQAVYHAIEHRTQIKALLTELGVPHPEFSAWHYAEGFQ